MLITLFGRMRSARIYVFDLAIIGALLVLSPIIMRAFAAPSDLPSSIAFLQFFACVCFLLTSLVSLGFLIWSLVKKLWSEAGVYSISVGLPWLIWWAMWMTNGEAVEAALRP